MSCFKSRSSFSSLKPHWSPAPLHLEDPWSSGDKELQASLAAELRGEVFLLGSQRAPGTGSRRDRCAEPRAAFPRFHSRAQVHRSPSHRPREASRSGSCLPPDILPRARLAVETDGSNCAHKRLCLQRAFLSKLQAQRSGLAQLLPGPPPCVL